MHEKLTISLDTNIEIYNDKNELLYQTHNTLTNLGKANIHSLLTSTAHINKLGLSPTTSTLAPELQTIEGFTLFDITDSYFTYSSGDLIMNFATNIKQADLQPLTSINRLGLCINSDVLFTVASSGSLSVGSSSISILYQIRLKITN